MIHTVDKREEDRKEGGKVGKTGEKWEKRKKGRKRDTQSRKEGERRRKRDVTRGTGASQVFFFPHTCRRL